MSDIGLMIVSERTLHINGDAMAKKIATHGVQSMNYHVPSVVDGSPISVRQWLPPPEVNIRAVLQLTHGISEHSGRYDRFARFLAENGVRVYASDLRGHGLSVPQSELGKASVHFWADTTEDMKQLLDLMHTDVCERQLFHNVCEGLQPPRPSARSSLCR
jgi:alpha-beta hydrolase superfamily lysophospholipase